MPKKKVEKPANPYADFKWQIAKVGLTQTAFCADVDGLTESNLSLYIAGKKTPRPLTVAKIKERLLQLANEKGITL